MKNYLQNTKGFSATLWWTLIQIFAGAPIPTVKVMSERIQKAIKWMLYAKHVKLVSALHADKSLTEVVSAENLTKISNSKTGRKSQEQLHVQNVLS